MAFHPYLFFGGNCREAFTRYHEIFGGDLVLLDMNEAPPDARSPGIDPNLIIHAALKIGDALVMASDDPIADPFGPVQGMQVNYSTTDAADAQRVFDALADGGQITGPFGPTFFSPAFGMCVDRFGTPWMVSADPPADGS
ncbi:MAG TPA: VOC family protein [Acidimicrobiia bacterium]|jgi:PhnB protein|nr:VOC family protein [Acidimicrobiia bacterium]